MRGVRILTLFPSASPSPPPPPPPPPPSSTTVTFVGSGGGAGGNTATTYSFSSLLDAAGAAPTILAGDMVCVAIATRTATTATATPPTGPTGYTELFANIYSDGTGHDTNVIGFYAFMGTTPDTTVSIPAGPGPGAIAFEVHVFRSVNQTTPNDVTPVTATITGANSPNAPAITPVTEGALIYVVGASAAASPITALGAPSNLSAVANHFVAGTSSTAAIAAGISTGWTTGAFDPATFTGGASAAGGSSAAVSLALRGAAGSPPPPPPPPPPPATSTVFVGSGAANGSNTTTVFNFSSLLDEAGAVPTLLANDMVCVSIATQTATTAIATSPTGPTGYIELFSNIYADGTTNDTNLRGFYNFMGATPATSVTIPAVSGVAAGDPFWSSTVFLSGFEGADQSQIYVDESSFARTITVAGTTANNRISTVNQKFGGSSLYRASTSTATITAADSADWHFASAPFTVEAWVRWLTVSSTTYDYILCQYDSGNQRSWALGLDNVTRTIFLRLANDVTVSGARFAESNFTPVAGTWYHIAADFDGTTYRIYVDGVMLGSQAGALTLANSAAPMSIGSYYDNGASTYSTNGNFDEVRITKGTARYASNSGYAVPTAAFPRNGSGIAFAVHVFRGIDSTTPNDVVPVSATVLGFNSPNAPAITTATSYSLIYVVGASAGASPIPALGAPSNISTLANSFVAATSNTVAIAAGVKTSWTGTFDPAAFTGGSNGSGGSSAAVSIVLRKTAVSPPPPPPPGPPPPSASTVYLRAGNYSSTAVWDGLSIVASTFSLQPGGNAVANADNGETYPWLLSGAATGYEARVTALSGTSSGIKNTWLELGVVNRSWSRNRTSVGSSSATILVEIATAGTGVALESATIVLSATLT